MARKSMQGQVALVTGASNGIGAGAARALAGRGAALVLADVDEDAGAALADELGGSFVRCDVRELGQLEAVVAHAIDRHGRIDLAHLNAGVTTGCGLGDDFDEASYRRAMGVNLDGVVFGVHAVLPAMLAQGGGSIVATASMAGIVAPAFDPVYVANKHAVVGLVRSLGAIYGPQGIRVNALCPSFADTAILGEIRPVLAEQRFPILEVSEVVDAFLGIVDADGTGECWFVVPGRPSEPFQFRNAPGPRHA
ncbi:MAG: SDR family NAD(P)-dependent oxidoreductase [Actinomycetota bacterium]|jgi:NAD(P)-dependent dehydrogenase (short-subunit alcohol dehydrogenase family)|nr:SDR family NAD(P)-dependent oxidoreductase [Actinomycetota bacterium]